MLTLSLLPFPSPLLSLLSIVNVDNSDSGSKEDERNGLCSSVASELFKSWLTVDGEEFRGKAVSESIEDSLVTSFSIWDSEDWDDDKSWFSSLSLFEL